MHLTQMVSAAVVVSLAVSGAMAGWSYDHELVKNKFLPLAAAPWSHDGGEACAKLAFPDAQTTMYEVDMGEYNLYGVITVSHKERVIAISFRGTTNFANAVDELVSWLNDQVLATLTASQYGGSGDGNVKVMSYFQAAWTKLFHDKMYPDILQMRPENVHYNFWVTGHSLGGALATLTARYLFEDLLEPSAAKGEAYKERQRVKLVTFGQPRTGTKAFADDCERKVPNHYRVFRADDYITLIPLRCIHPLVALVTDCAWNGYSHLPKAIRYRHPMGPNDYETYAEEVAKFKTKPWLAHHMYFGKHISNWGSGNCKGDGSQRRGGLRERSEENQIEALVLLLARKGFYGPEAQKQSMSLKANKQSMQSVAERLRKAGIPGF